MFFLQNMEYLNLLVNILNRYQNTENMPLSFSFAIIANETLKIITKWYLQQKFSRIIFSSYFDFFYYY